jgi:hypothetical protein
MRRTVSGTRRRGVSWDTFSRLVIRINGDCPEARAEPIEQEAQAANGECECAEVRCGGVPLGPDQGCCNGRPFTLGTEGCCHGVIVDASTPCKCQGEAIDLAVAGCCGSIFDPALETCCHQVEGGEACNVDIYTTSTFNLGFDCCPGPVASESEFCDGQCVGSECAASGGCCQCSGCLAGPQCVAGGAESIEGGSSAV